MADDAREFFDTHLPEAAKAKPEQIKQLGRRFQFNLTGDGGGAWYVDATSSGPRIEQGDPGTADLTITLPAADFRQLRDDPNAGVRLYFAGTLKMQGDPSASMQVPQLLKM
ncbi:SCP2 sterol-binding domain-containing protein [Actinomadura gamaensis]|uniref:SCP2 sterol-binding domain-containing protein n=1 Tax=Actinomadura gamaensis TaxID=1763541 RepID=A0ABV9U9S6_9ACTN